MPFSGSGEKENISLGKQSAALRWPSGGGEGRAGKVTQYTVCTLFNFLLRMFSCFVAPPPLKPSLGGWGAAPARKPPKGTGLGFQGLEQEGGMQALSLNVEN